MKRFYSKAYSINDIISFCKRRGFIFQSSSIYGGLTGTFDYGSIGFELKNNIRQLWYKDFIKSREDCVAIDTPIILHPKVWENSGHIQNFVDPLVECKECKRLQRADHLITDTKGLDELIQKFKENPPICPCEKKKNSWSEVRTFNMLFKTNFGPTFDNQVYLRPETAQGIFINFENVVTTSRKRVPFGIGQMGKSFRNEISPRDFIFRTREFEQMELEYFCHPNESSKFFNEWVHFCKNWLIQYGLKEENIRLKEYSKEELAHYASQTTDIEFNFPFGWGELWGIANRGDYDLKVHSKEKEIIYTDPKTNEKFVPHVIEPAVGLDRLFLSFISDAYNVEKDPDRVVLKLHKKLAPKKFAIFPLIKREEFIDKAEHIYHKLLSMDISVDFDNTGSIGAMYRRHDEIGTPYCITVDHDTLKDDTITIRDRDTMKQERMSIYKFIDSAEKLINI